MSGPGGAGTREAGSAEDSFTIAISQVVVARQHLGIQAWHFQISSFFFFFKPKEPYSWIS